MEPTAAELSLDVVELILLRLDVEDIIRCKSICKSWYSFISGPTFVKAHLKHSYHNDRNNPEFEHRRISNWLPIDEDYWLSSNFLCIVGSCNGLVCVTPKDVEFVVINPCTREEKKLQTPPPFLPPHTHEVRLRKVLCWGFGYDSSADDYKFILGFRDKMQTLFYVLTLKSNVWKFIGEVKYWCDDVVTGILCGGALHWFMSDANKKRVLISLDLSTEEFKQVPQPTNRKKYQGHKRCYGLGILEECLCIYSLSNDRFRRWVMRNNKWETRHGECESKYDLLHTLVESQTTTGYTLDDGRSSPSDYGFMFDCVFVKSLVSPHPYNDNYYEGRKMNTMGQKSNQSVQSGVKGNIRKRKRNVKA